MKLKTFREHFELLNDQDCFMATFYTLERTKDINEILDAIPLRRNGVFSGFPWSMTYEGDDHWSRINKKLNKILT